MGQIENQKGNRLIKSCKKYFKDKRTKHSKLKIVSDWKKKKKPFAIYNKRYVLNKRILIY